MNVIVTCFLCTDPDVFPYKTKAELRRPRAHAERFTKADLLAMPELTPPVLMPAGNVGTPVSVFLQLIQSCRLPSRLIRKLGLTFPKTGSHRRYGNVPYQYNTAVVGSNEESVFTAGGVEICGPGSVAPPKSTGKPQENKGQPIGADHPADGVESEVEEESGPDDVSHFNTVSVRVCMCGCVCVRLLVVKFLLSSTT